MSSKSRPNVDYIDRYRIETELRRLELEGPILVGLDELVLYRSGEEEENRRREMGIEISVLDREG